MIGRLSKNITNLKEFIYQRPPLRLLFYLLAALALLFFWLYADTGEVAFIYNAF